LGGLEVDSGRKKELEGEEDKEQGPQKRGQTKDLKKEIRQVGSDEARQVGGFLRLRELIVERGVVRVVGEQTEGQEGSEG
jgi:hypothetical protein